MGDLKVGDRVQYAGGDAPPEGSGTVVSVNGHWVVVQWDNIERRTEFDSHLVLLPEDEEKEEKIETGDRVRFFLRDRETNEYLYGTVLGLYNELWAIVQYDKHPKPLVEFCGLLVKIINEGEDDVS